MLFGKTKLELKVGAFVFFGLIILVIFILSIGGIKTWTSGYYVNFTFNFVNGVKLGAPVRFAGVDVGQIKNIKFISKPQEKIKVEVVSWIKKEIKIPVDSTVWINTLGLLGEKYVEIVPGSDSRNFLLAHQTLAGKEPIAMHEVEQTTKHLVDDIDGAMKKIKDGEGTLGKLLVDDTLYSEIEALVLDLKSHPWKLFWKTKENK